MATPAEELQLGMWAVRCDPIAGEVLLNVAPDIHIALSPEAAMCMANYLAFNAAFVGDIQAAMLADGLPRYEEEAS